MKITAVIETTFSGAHTVPELPICAEPHGHVWRVRVEIAALEYAAVAEVAPTVITLVRQYHHKDLDRFLPGAETSPSGLGALFREILSDYPISAIEVIPDDGIGARLEWPVR